MQYFAREQSWQKQLLREIAQELKIDLRVVREVGYYPLIYLKHRISNPDEDKPVRIRHLGVWDLKTTVENKTDVTKKN